MNPIMTCGNISQGVVMLFHEAFDMSYIFNDSDLSIEFIRNPVNTEEHKY
jgi:hypothetical protein